MNGYEPVHPHLRRVWERLSQAAREARYRQGMERKEVLGKVEALSAVMSERAALREVGLDRTTYRRWHKRYLLHGVDGLMDWRVPPQSPVSPQVQEAIRTMRRVEPNVSVEKIIEHV